jgi:hypothetical protein
MFAPDRPSYRNTGGCTKPTAPATAKLETTGLPRYRKITRRDKLAAGGGCQPFDLSEHNLGN